MPAQLKNDDSRIDDHYNDKLNNAKGLSEAENNFSDIADNYGETADPTDEDAAIARAKSASEAVGEQEDNTSGAWMNNVSGRGAKGGGGRFSLKKSGGPAGIIISLIIGVAGITSFFGGPGLLIVNLAEKINEKFNYQLTTMDIRTKKILNAKIKNTTTGFMCSPVSILCKYASFSDKEIDNFRKAGIEIETDSKTVITGRNKVKSISFEGGPPISPEEFARKINDPREFKFNAAVKKGFNPKFAGFADSVFDKIATKLRISKKAPFSDADGASDETRFKRIDEDTRNGRSTGEIDTTNDSSCNAECQRKRSGTQADLDKAASEAGSGAESQTSKAMRELGAADFGAGIGSATSLIKVTGVVDDACTVYGMFKAVSMGAKVLRGAQMANFAMTFLTTASMIKAGDAKAEDVSFLGTMLTQTYSTKEGGQTVMTKAATDSFGYRYTAFGDKGIAGDENAMQALVGAGSIGKLDGVLATVLGLLGGKRSADEKCKINNNFFVQGASLVVGILLLLTPVGQGFSLSKIPGLIALTAATITAQLVLPALLADMIAGRLIDKNTVGETAGNFIVSGSGHLHSLLAQGGGNAPLKPAQATAYMRASEVVAQEYRTLDQYTHSPFDASNPNTFLGSIYSRFAPFFASTPSSLLQLSSIPATIVGSTFANLTPQASAAESDFQECQDPDYVDIGVATDPFCNIIFGIPVALAGDDPNAINSRLINQGLIDDITGEPVGPYIDFIKNCIDRQVPIGSTGADSTTDMGESCFITNKTTGLTSEEQTRVDMYVHYIDQRVNYTMENGYSSTGNTAASTTAANLGAVSSSAGQTTTIGNYALPTDQKWFDQHPDWFSKPHHDYPAADIRVPEGTPIYAVSSGVVLLAPAAKADEGLGLGVVIMGDDGVRYSYGHGSDGGKIVKPGDIVKAGQLIMHSASTGHSDGPHLHLAVSIKGVMYCPQNLLIALGKGETMVPAPRSLPTTGCVK